MDRGDAEPARSHDHVDVRAADELLTEIDDRKHAEGTLDMRAAHFRRVVDALEASERDLTLITETIPGFVWTASTDGQLTHVNKRISAYIGMSIFILSSDGWLDDVHPDDRASALETWMRCVATGAPLENQYRLRRADGVYRWFNVSRQLGHSSDGQPTQWYGLLVDVDDRKRAEEMLRATEAYVTEAQRLSRTGSFGWKPDTGEIVWSDETCRIFEYNRGETPCLEMLLERIHPQDKTLAQQIVERASATGGDFEHQCRLLMASGAIKYLHLRARAVPDSSGNLEFIGAITDISQRKTAEEKIRQQETALLQLLNFMPQLVVVFGPNHERLYANRAALDYRGIGLDEWREDMTVHPDDQDRVRGHAYRASLSRSINDLRAACALPMVDMPGARFELQAPEGEDLHVNRQVLEYFGRSLGELKKRGTTRVGWPHAIQTGSPDECEHRLRHQRKDCGPIVPSAESRGRWRRRFGPWKRALASSSRRFLV
jgi:PAS domain S-box-containing protein